MAFSNAIKISGYLEKKGKLRIGSLWKRYWFVLEGRLLLYYRSKDEYETLSPCKGSINLCPPCNVQPSSSSNYAFQIQCRATTYTLKAENRWEQERWMQALLTVIVHSKTTQNRMLHFRYSLDNLPIQVRENQNAGYDLLRQNSMPHRISNTKSIVDRLQQIGAHTYGGSLETIIKLSEKNGNANSPHNDGSTNFSYYSETQNIDQASVGNLFNRGDRMQKLYSDNEHYSVIQEENSIDLISYNGKKAVLDQNNDLLTKKCDFKIEGFNEIFTNSLYEEVKIDRDDKITINKLYEPFASCTDESALDETHYDVIGSNEKSNEFEESARDNNLDKSALISDNKLYVRSTDNYKEDVHLQNSSHVPYGNLSGKKYREHLYEDPDLLLKKVNKKSKKLFNNFERPKLPKKKLKKSLDKDADSNEKSKSKIKSIGFLHRVLRRKNKSLEIEEEPVYDSINYEYVKKGAEHEGDIEMLQELQKILETRKIMLQQKLNVDTSKRESQILSTSSEIETRPSLPPRQHSQTSINVMEQLKETKTIDEILEDLEKDNDGKAVECQLDGKVISSKRDSYKTNQNSDELAILLEELSKVTCAPVMTPGVTNSLVMSPFINNDLLKLIPIRKRRLSEPDYDVPRPHSSLHFMETTNSEQENPIPITRFFDLCPLQSSNQKIKYQSMDPDSLDQEKQIECSRTQIESNNIDLSVSCIKEHDSAFSISKLIDSTQSTTDNILGKVQSKCEDFVDSLEHTAEISTTF